MYAETDSAQPRAKANPEEFIHIFVGQPDWLAKFLEFIIQQGLATDLVYNTLLEIYLREDGDDAAGNDRKERLNKAVALLTDPRVRTTFSWSRRIRHSCSSSKAKFNADLALVLCQMHDFKPGILAVYERLALYPQSFVQKLLT